MDNERSPWHSDDELASALEHSLEETTATASIPVISSPGVANPVGASIEDLFASLVEETTSSVREPAVEQAVVVETAAAVHVEGVYETLDDFRPRTNFIPVQAPATENVTATVRPETVPVETAPASSQVTMPVQWTPQRKSFDEIVFGSPAL